MDMKNIQTTALGWLKIAVGLWYAYDKFSHGQALTEADMMVLAALGLGGASSIASADARALKASTAPAEGSPPTGPVS